MSSRKASPPPGPYGKDGGSSEVQRRISLLKVKIGKLAQQLATCNTYESYAGQLQMQLRILTDQLKTLQEASEAIAEHGEEKGSSEPECEEKPAGKAALAEAESDQPYRVFSDQDPTGRPVSAVERETLLLDKTLHLLVDGRNVVQPAPVRLSPAEAQLLVFYIEHRGKPHIPQNVYGAASRTAATRMLRNLKRKLAEAGEYFRQAEPSGWHRPSRWVFVPAPGQRYCVIRHK